MRQKTHELGGTEDVLSHIQDAYEKVEKIHRRFTTKMAQYDDINVIDFKVPKVAEGQSIGRVHNRHFIFLLKCMS